MYRVGKTFHFEAAHQLPNHDGKCKNKHGHSYSVEVIVQGPTLHPVVSHGVHSPKEGMLIDFGDIKRIVTPYIERFDHSGAVEENLAVLIFDKGWQIDTVSTAELIAYILYQCVKEDLPPGITLVSISVKETSGTFAEYSE